MSREIKVNDGGDIVMIRHLPVSRSTVALLRQICVHFKVSWYKNQNKESTLGLLKNLVMREGLKNKMYDDNSASYHSVSSQDMAQLHFKKQTLVLRRRMKGHHYHQETLQTPERTVTMTKTKCLCVRRPKLSADSMLTTIEIVI